MQKKSIGKSSDKCSIKLKSRDKNNTSKKSKNKRVQYNHPKVTLKQFKRKTFSSTTLSQSWEFVYLSIYFFLK